MTFWGYAHRLIVLILLWFVIFNLWVFLNIAWWIKFNPSSSAFMRARLSAMREEHPDATLKHHWVDYAQMSIHLKRALIASEDAKFMQHQGFDWEGVELAFKKNIQKGKLVAGGSTITQQLAKNMFLSSRRSLFRKLEEAVITVMLEKMLSKQRIYEIYLNMIEWGNGVFGAEAAARHYYQTGANRLGVTQAAKLAVMVPNPRFYDTHRNTPYIKHRTATIQT
ncbi:MAG: monofunctional biosynthetic peptidoglycan transglycosylase, partial [Methylophilaceae bacterium]|nr:monofunctional biosynthetic peptidoglycan transglycosylase [Methylophilaceae bacterium]